MTKKKNIRWQVFEKAPGTKGDDGKDIIHNFSVEEKAAKDKLVRRLKKEGKLSGEVWDCENNHISNMFKF